MRDELNVVCRKTLQVGAALGLTLAVSTQAFALKAGHGRVDTPVGAPLRVLIPLLDVVASDIPTLQAKVAPPAAWANAGLTPPVSLDSITVSIQQGFTKDSRTLSLVSNQVADKQIIDVLVEVSAASGSTQVQSSFLVLTRANEGSAGTVLVKVGDTLSGIALAHPVSGADLYQMLWALYQANPQAFFSQNMNLLKAGVTLTMPDAQTVRAIDAKLAREMFQKHWLALNRSRGDSGTVSAAPHTPAVVAPTGSTQSGVVSAASTAPTPTGADRVLLTSASTAEQREDARVAAAKELAEIQSRVENLQQNVQQLKDALNQSPGAAAGSAAIAGATGASGAPGTPGAAGTPGTPGAAGTPGTPGTPGASGAASATGATGTAAAGAPSFGLLSQFWSTFTSSAVGILTAVLAIGGLLVAWLLRRAGARRELDQVEGDDTPEALNPKARSALDEKLQGIDLNLDSPHNTVKKEPSISKPGTDFKV